MVEPLEASIRFLGQAGFRLVLEGVVIYLDPYLSHSVEKFDNPLLVRAVALARPGTEYLQGSIVTIDGGISNRLHDPS